MNNNNLIKNNKIFLLIVLIGLFFSGGVSAYGGSNLGYAGYPDDECVRPVAPNKPMDYNKNVKDYNNDVADYHDCVKEYVENARNDMDDIEKITNKLIKEANRL